MLSKVAWNQRYARPLLFARMYSCPLLSGFALCFFMVTTLIVAELGWVLVKSGTLTGPIPLFNGTHESEHYKEGFYVATLQGVSGADASNAHRLDNFLAYFGSICPGIHFKVCPGTFDKRPGYGIGKTWTKCITKALRDDVDVAYFFEDDARFRQNVTDYSANKHKFCSRDFRNALWRSAPLDTFLVLFGGHHFRYRGRRRFKSPTIESTFYDIDNAWGSYSWAVPTRTNMKVLREGFLKDLSSAPTINTGTTGNKIEMISPDETKIQHAIDAGKTAYLLAPLLYVHPAGFSNTWGGKYEATPVEDPPLDWIFYFLCGIDVVLVSILYVLCCCLKTKVKLKIDDLNDNQKYEIP
jgi:hypothetical protein